MAGPSVTYTFANSTAADASQVNTNFTDLINGMTDGTKDFSISALTCAGAATFNGNVTLGNASSDDITVTGSLASSIPIKTTFSYDFGSATIGLKSLYLGSDDSAAKSVRLIAPTIATSYTLTLPTSAGTSGYALLSAGAGAAAVWTNVGEIITETVNETTWPFAADIYGDLDTIELTSGTWSISWQVQIRISPSDTSCTFIGAYIGTASGTSSTGVSAQTNGHEIVPPPTANGSRFGLRSSGYIVTPASTTTYYLKGLTSTSNTNVNYQSRITAVRIR